jgi:hypothetical protein
MNLKDNLKGFAAGVGVCLTLLIGIAASPTDSTVRGYLRGLVDSTASPPPLAQATNATFRTASVTNAFSAGSLTATGAVSGLSGAFPAVNAASGTVTNALSVGAMSATGAVSGLSGAFPTVNAASGTVTNALSVGAMSATGAVSGLSGTFTTSTVNGAQTVAGVSTVGSLSSTGSVSAGSGVFTTATIGGLAGVNSTNLLFEFTNHVGDLLRIQITNGVFSASVAAGS